MKRIKAIAVVSFLVLTGTFLFFSPIGKQVSNEKTTTLSILRNAGSYTIDVSHRHYDIIELEEYEEGYLRLLFNVEVRGPQAGFTLKSIPSETDLEGTEIDLELGRLPNQCIMGLQYVSSDAQGVAGEDTAQFAIVAFLRGGAKDWAVKNPKVTIKNLLLEFDVDLANRSTPLISMDVEANLLNETQYKDWMNSLITPIQEIQIINPSIRSIVKYDTANKTDLKYELLFNVWVEDVDGLQDIANVSVRFPDGTTINLEDEGTGLEYHPSGDGEYFNVVIVEQPITGTFTFDVTDFDGKAAQSNASVSEWLEPFDWAQPESGETLNVSTTNLVFNTSKTDLQDFTITIGNETTKYEGFWSINTNTTHVEYDGIIPLENGEYWWTLLARSELENIIQAYTEFEVQN